MNKSYDSGGKILRNFINKIESMIYENNARLIGEPINIVFHVNNIQKFYRDEYKQFNQFNYNGKYIISVFDKDIEKYFKSHFPNLKIKIENTTLINSITITDYLNHDIILKESGIGIWELIEILSFLSFLSFQRLVFFFLIKIIKCVETYNN